MWWLGFFTAAAIFFSELAWLVLLAAIGASICLFLTSVSVLISIIPWFLFTIFVLVEIAVLFFVAVTSADLAFTAGTAN